MTVFITPVLLILQRRSNHCSFLLLMMFTILNPLRSLSSLILSFHRRSCFIAHAMTITFTCSEPIRPISG